MKTRTKSLMYDVLTDWRTWATFGLSAAGWCQLLGGHWAIASIAFCAAAWIQILKK
jgi:hypothetical protein